jgi:hypothetical protein
VGRGKLLGNDELCDVVNLVKKPEGTVKMMEANVVTLVI